MDDMDYGRFLPGVTITVTVGDGECTFTRKPDQWVEGFRMPGAIAVVFDFRVFIVAEAPRNITTADEAAGWASGYWQGFHAGKAYRHE